MTKILVISPSHFPGTSGDSTNYTEIVNQLSKEGLNVFLVCPKTPLSKKLPISISKDVETIRISYLPPRLNEIKDKAKIKDYFRLLVFLLKEAFTVWRVVKQKKIKYVIMRHDITTVQLPLLLKLLRVSTIADGELFGDILKNKTKGFFYKFAQRFEKSAINCYSFFKVSSESHSKKLQKLGFPKSKILIAPIAINLEKIPQFSIDDIPKHTFGYFGNLEEWQGVETLVKAFQILQKKIPESRLYIIGDGTQKPKLEKIVSENELSSNVFFDSVSREVLLNDYFKKFRVAVIPRPKQNDEKDFIIPIKLIEAFAAAKPLIVMNIPIMNEIAKNSVFVVKSDSVESLASAMEEVSSNEKLMKDLSQNVNELSKNYDVGQIVDKLIASLINEKNN